MAVSTGDGLNALEKRIIRQVEYYFGDINLPQDEFLQAKTQEDDGWVRLDLMLCFNRLKSITKDKAAICQALLKSSSGVIEVSEDLSKIRRCPTKPFPERQDINARTVYVQGFPEAATRDMLMDFFEQYGQIDTVIMRCYQPDKTFKGSVFVIFSDTNEKDKFLAMEEIKYQDIELIKMTKDEHLKKKEENRKRKNEDKSGNNREEKKEEEEMRMDERMTKGAVLYMKGLPKDITLEDMKNYFGDFGNVAWVELATGDDKKLVRFMDAEAESALNKAKAANNGKVIIHDSELEIGVLKGEQETEYWCQVFQDIADHIQKSIKKRCQNRKRKFGNRSDQQGFLAW